MATSRVTRRTFTLTTVENEMLTKIAQHRHPTDIRVESMTLRELIREEYKRLEQEEKQKKDKR